MSTPKERINALLENSKHTRPDREAEAQTKDDSLSDPKHQKGPDNPGGPPWAETEPGSGVHEEKK